jgi:hypothetical protein
MRLVREARPRRLDPAVDSIGVVVNGSARPSAAQKEGDQQENGDLV